MVSTTCKYCGSQKIESLKHGGELVCSTCGAVLEENVVLEDVQYAETSAGNSTLVGQFIPTIGSRRLTLAYGSWQCRELVIKRGYHNIQRIADYLSLSSEHVERAQKIYLLAVQRNFTMGRNNLHVASCCLYTICRREKTPYLLIDFSDILQTPVKTIGQVFMKLVRMLHINVPNVDPSIFFERFANQLQLKDKIQKIIFTGNRIIQAMNRDWLCTGRRPTGLCGAALVVAARFHGIPITAEAVASVVRISHPTIMKRLSEFKSTSTANLKTCDFNKVDLESLPSMKFPPCLISKFLQGRKRAACAGEFGTSLEVPNSMLCNQEPSADDISTIANEIIRVVGGGAEFGVTNGQAKPGGIGEFDSNLKFGVTGGGEADDSLSSDDEADEKEFKKMMLPEDEKASKALIWDEITKDIMPELFRRQMERKKREEMGEKVVKRRYRRRVLEYPEALDAAESTRMALQRHAKGFFNRINDEVFNSLLGGERESAC